MLLGDRVPLRAQYADAKTPGMGGDLLLYMTRSAESEGIQEDAEVHASDPDGAMQDELFAHAVNTISNASASATLAAIAASGGQSQRAIARTWMNDFWNISVSMGGEYHVLHNVLHEESADAAHIFFDAYLPGAANFARHSLRMYANALRTVIIGVAYTGNQVTQGKLLSKDTLWGLVEPALDEQMATAHSLYEVVHMFMYGAVGAVEAYADKTTTLMCDKSDIQNNLMQESLKIVHAVST